MDVGTGIAIAGAWLFAGLSMWSADLTGWGKRVAMLVAGWVTFYLAG